MLHKAYLRRSAYKYNGVISVTVSHSLKTGKRKKKIPQKKNCDVKRGKATNLIVTGDFL